MVATVASKTTRADAEKTERANPTNGGESVVAAQLPITVHFRLKGTSDLLFHHWNPEYVDMKAGAAKGSESKKTDDLEMYIYRLAKPNDDPNKPTGNLSIPGEYVRQSIIGSAKYKQDPRSPRKSAQDLFKAGVVALTELADTGKPKWDFEDRRRVVVQRNGINRTRPGLKAGWEADFDFLLMTPEYVNPQLFHEVLAQAGRLIGLADFRPTFGRFSVINFETLKTR